MKINICWSNLNFQMQTMIFSSETICVTYNGPSAVRSLPMGVAGRMVTFPQNALGLRSFACGLNPINNSVNENPLQSVWSNLFFTGPISFSQVPSLFHRSHLLFTLYIYRGLKSKRASLYLHNFGFACCLKFGVELDKNVLNQKFI